MMRMVGVLFVAFVLFTGLLRVDAEDGTVDLSPVKEAVADLSADDFGKREEATRWLWEAGPEAAPDLREAMLHGDPEVIHRARWVLDQFRLGIEPKIPARDLPIRQ